MKQNFGKTAVFCNILLDLIINTGAVYLAILILDRDLNIFNIGCRLYTCIFCLRYVLLGNI